MGVSLAQLHNDILTSLLDFLDPFEVCKLASQVGNTALSLALGRSCRNLIIEAPFHVKTKPLRPDFIRSMSCLTVLHICTPNYTPFHTYSFVTSLPRTLTDLDFRMPYAHAMWVVSVVGKRRSTVSRPEWFEGPSVVRLGKLLPHLTRLCLQEGAIVQEPEKQFPKLFAKFLQTLPKSLTSLSLNQECLGYSENFPKSLLELCFRNGTGYSFQKLVVSEDGPRHPLFNCSQLHTLVLNNVIATEAINYLPRTLTDLSLAPLAFGSPSSYFLDENSNLSWPPQLTSLEFHTSTNDWNTVIYLPRTLKALKVVLGPMRERPVWKCPPAEVFPPFLTSLVLLCGAPAFLPPIPPTVTKLDLQHESGPVPPESLGNACSISLRRSFHQVPEHWATDGAIKHISWMVSPAMPLTIVTLFPKNLTSAYFRCIQEKCLLILCETLPSLRSLDLDCVRVDGATLKRDETDFTEDIVANGIMSYVGHLLPKTKQIRVAEQLVDERPNDCLLHLDVEVFWMGAPAGTPDFWRFPPTLRHIDFPALHVRNAAIFGAIMPLAEFLSVRAIYGTMTLPHLRTLRVQEGPGIVLDRRQTAGYPLEHISFPDATIYTNQVPGLDGPQVKLLSVQLGDINFELLQRHPLIQLELTQFQQWDKLQLLPRTITSLKLGHPSVIFSLIPDDLVLSLPPSLTLLGLPYMPSNAFFQVPPTLTELQLEWASFDDSQWFKYLEGHHFDSFACEGFLSALRLQFPFKIWNPRHKQGLIAVALTDTQVAENSNFTSMVLRDHTLTPECFSKLPPGLTDLTFGCTSILLVDVLTSALLSVLPSQIIRLDLHVYRMQISALSHLPPGLTYLNVRLDQVSSQEKIVFPASLLSLKVASPVSITASKPIFPPNLRSLYWNQAIGYRWYREEYPVTIDGLLPDTMESLSLCGCITMFHPLSEVMVRIKHLAMLNYDETRVFL